MTETETVELPSDEDEELRREANKRVGLSDQYERQLSQVKRERRQENIDDTDDTNEPLKVRAASAVLDKLDGLEERIDQSQREIKGAETKPEMDTKSTYSAIDSARDVEEIRFTFTNGETSQWYTWEPDNPDHPLNKIIDYYAGGDITQMFGETVMVATVYDDPHISYPTPYDTKTGHYRFKLYSVIDKFLNDTDNGKYYKILTVSSHQDSPVDDSVSHHNALSSDGAEVIGGAVGMLTAFPIIAGILTLLYGAFNWIVLKGLFEFTATPEVGNLFELGKVAGVLIVMGVIGTALVGKYTYHGGDSHFDNSMGTAFVTSIYLLILPFIAMWSIGSRIRGYLGKKFSQFNSYEPYA